MMIAYQVSLIRKIDGSPTSSEWETDTFTVAAPSAATVDQFLMREADTLGWQAWSLRPLCRYDGPQVVDLVLSMEGEIMAGKS